ncbi:hypothetical protein U9M48_034869 [Paspalum notatum var. saurae]|uniref:Reverse transcriptase zinc-binding domain-containing protein n=1 Tax=Paspalum notatum var. saurae TaxID=547442 RepID=A0AAQ3UAJ8_PASNO
MASGLFSNLDKSVATPIHCSPLDVQRVQAALAFKVEGFPCKYLGIPLLVYKLKRSEERPLIDKVAARIPGWKGNLLNTAGRMALVKAALSAILIHTSIALCLSPWMIGAIDKLRRTFIWAGTDSVAGGQCKVAWETCCRPKELGGLGISDLRRVGIALRVRWVWKDRREGRYPETKERSVLALFHAVTLAPVVFRSVSSRKLKVTVAEALHNNDWVPHVTGPATLQLLVEIGRLCDLLDGVNLSPNPDTFLWWFSQDQAYSAASAYGAMFFGSSPLLGAKQIWKTAAPLRVRFFFWLVLHGRCWTAERRFRHGLQPTPTCIFCDQLPETMDHILLGCSFSREVWHICLANLHLLQAVVVREEQALGWWLLARKGLPKVFRRGFDSFFFLAGWLLWKERNARTFDGVLSTPAQLASRILEEANAWCAAGFKQLAGLLARGVAFRAAAASS